MRLLHCLMEKCFSSQKSNTFCGSLSIAFNFLRTAVMAFQAKQEGKKIVKVLYCPNLAFEQKLQNGLLVTRDDRDQFILLYKKKRQNFSQGNIFRQETTRNVFYSKGLCDNSPFKTINQM